MPRRLDDWRIDPSQVLVLLHGLRERGESRATMGLHPGRPARALGSTCETTVFRNWVQRRPFAAYPDPAARFQLHHPS